MASLDDGIPRLFLDIKGDIWLGEQRIDSNLPRLLRKSLDYLWNHRDRFISYDEFLEMLYGDSLPTRADPIASSDKIIKRLRKHLEGKTNGSSHRYIEIQTGKGYLLRNFREEEIEHGA
jgi:DNA-binding response OmpR family regulator